MQLPAEQSSMYKAAKYCEALRNIWKAVEDYARQASWQPFLSESLAAGNLKTDSMHIRAVNWSHKI